MNTFNPQLSELQQIQTLFDGSNNTAGARYNDQVLHTGLHLVNAANKILRLCERKDHPESTVEESVVTIEVIPDLIIMAATLANHYGIDLSKAVEQRYQSLEQRNGTANSFERAINGIKE